MRQLKHVHFGLFCLDMNYGFLSERQIGQGQLEGRRLVIVPAADYVAEETVNRLQSYLKAGGTVLIIGDSLSHDERGQQRDLSGWHAKSQELMVAGFPVTMSHFGSGRIYRTTRLSGQQYRRFFDAFLDEVGIHRSYRITDMQGGSVDGVDFRTTQLGTRRLAYLINLSRQQVKIKLVSKAPARGSVQASQPNTQSLRSAHDLITNQPVTFPLEIAPLDVKLMEIQEAED